MKKFFTLLILSLAFFYVQGQNRCNFIDPASLEATLNLNDSVVLYTIMYNDTEDTLEFDFPQYSGDGQGGPDEFGYTWIDSDEPCGPEYGWTEISETGTLVEGLGDDIVVGPFDIGFEFPYYGQTKTQFWIQSNGCISFNDQLVSFANYPIPTNNSYLDFIAWFWDDLTIDTGFTSVFYKTIEEQTIIQFNKMTHYPGTEEWITAQVVLKHNGTIFIRYKQIRENFPVDNCTVGLQSGEGDLGLQVIYNAPYLHSELAIRFDLNRYFITSVSPAAGYLPPNTQEHIWITYNSTGFEPGTYEQELKCLFNLPDHPYEIVHNVMHVLDPDQAGFKGYVTRADNGEPINDVKVIAGEQHVYTNDQGYYELPLEQGVYNVKFLREGFQTLIVEDTTALPGFSILDVELEGYYFIAGQVFAGDPHIETGFVYGYKMVEGIVVDIYAEMVGEEGWYEFSGLGTAQYIVKAEPSPNSMYYGEFLPTYFGDVLHWEEATIIPLPESTDDAHIHLIAATTAPQGSGSISGIINNEASRSGVADIPIILQSTDPDAAFITYSASDGSFLFSGLALDDYTIFAEIPGKSITPQPILVDELHNAVSGIEMLILDNQIIFVGMGIPDVFGTAPFIYPNPVKDHLNISLDPARPVALEISVTDITGRIVIREERKVSGNETIILDASKLAQGVYNLIIEGRDVLITERIVK